MNQKLEKRVLQARTLSEARRIMIMENVNQEDWKELNKKFKEKLVDKN